LIVEVEMYLVDTDVISETRKTDQANGGVLEFLATVARENTALYISVITVGELRHGVELIRHRGDSKHAARLERWLQRVSGEYGDSILPFDEDAAHVWGRLRVPQPENPLDKQIAATALIYDLTLVTRNVAHYQGTGVRLINPFT
jgi:predicted nucleic acid-binding protein